MAQWIINPSRLEGKIEIPPSKSQTMRALLFALMAKGKSQITHFLPSPDTEAMIEALSSFGAAVTMQGGNLEIQGTGGVLTPAQDVIACGNSGQVLRFIAALSALSPSYTVLTGDPSIRRRRPAAPLLDALTQLGAFATSSRGDGFAPLIVRGPLTGNRASLDGRDSQPVSGLLMAASFAPHPIELLVSRPGEQPWVRLTLSWLDRFGISYEQNSFERYRLQGGASIDGFTYEVPGDFSSAAFPLAAALLTQSEISIFPIDMGDAQGDKAIIPLLRQMGAQLEIDMQKKILHVKQGGALKGKKIDVNDFIDAFPILAVMGCFCEGTMELYNGAAARHKESDRIHCIALELKKMGAQIEEKSDGLLLHPSKLYGASLQSHEDHRIALALAVAAMAASGESRINGIETSAKSFPSFREIFKAAGAKIEGEP